jgi:hypothetical protein
MGVPSSIRVGTMTVPVGIQTNNQEHEGTTFWQPVHVELNGIVSEDQRRGTLVHEVLHLCAHEVMIPDRYTPKFEGFISQISNILLDTLRRNPELVKYLLEEGDYAISPPCS